MNAPFNPKAATTEAFRAFVEHGDTQEAVRAAVAMLGWSSDHIQSGGVRMAADTLAVSPSPSVLLVDLSGCADPMAEVEALAEVCEPGTLVFACGTANDIALYRQLIASGVQDYLVKPFAPAQLHQAILAAQVAESDARERDRVATKAVEHVAIAVIGVRGGSGASTVAVSTAWALAEKRDRQTALLDLDMHWGTGAMALDLDPGRGLSDAIENPNRIDGLFIERALVRGHEKLGVLSAEAPIHTPLQGDGTAFLYLQDELRNGFATTVIDLPRHMLIQHPALLESVGVVVLVTELTLAATRDTIRLLAWFKTNAPKTRILLLANKAQPGDAGEIGRKEFEASIERGVDVVVPYDASAAVQAAKLGKPMIEVAGASKSGQALGQLLPLVLNEAPEASNGKSLLDQLGGLASLFKKPPRPTAPPPAA